MWKPKDLDEERPLYLAIAEALQRDIAEGRLEPGARMPTQRELSRSVGVDLSTVTRAYAEGARRGLLSATVGRGTFVSADVAVSVPLLPDDAHDSGLLEMGLVLPLYSLERELIEEMKTVFAETDIAPYLRYCEPRGMAEHREAGARWVGRYGIRAKAEDILIASGTQNGLASVLMALLKPGDRLAVEALSYPGLKTVAAMLGIRLVPIPMDKDGLIPEELEAACRREAPRALYLMPEVQNPTTLALSEPRRDAIADIVLRRGLVLLEDDAYADTREGRRPALGSRIPDNAIFFGGISKMFGAGLRISFLAVPRRFVGAVERALLASVWMASPLSAMLVARIMDSGAAERIIEAKKVEARRRSALANARLSSARFHCPRAGFFGWLELPSGWTGRDFEIAARAEGLRLFCAEKFAVGGRSPAAVRLSLSGPETLEDVERGMGIVAGMLARGPRGEAAIL